MRRAGKTIRDAVHGDIALERDEIHLIDTAGMQRLRGVRQLGTAHLVYPSAVHTRFEHALGACALAGKILDTVEEASGRRFSSDERRLARTAALLHDITHAPFSHTFEDERRIALRHDRDPQRLERIFEQGTGDALHRQGLLEDVRKLLLKSVDKPGDPILYEIFAGTICADLLDYLRRDAFHCGLAQDYDNRIFSLFTRVDGHLALDLRRGGLFRHDALSELIHLLRLRYALTERVYYHHAKVSAGAMLSKALEMALSAGVFAYEELYVLRDESFLYLLRQRAATLPPTQALLDALERRSLHKPAYLLTNDDFHARLSAQKVRELERLYHYNAEDARTRLEEELCEVAEAPPGSVIVYCPAADMALKEARIQVRIDETTTRSLDALHHPEVDILLEKHRRLWRLVALASPIAAKRFTAIVELCEARLGVPNMLPQQEKGWLTFSARFDEERGDEEMTRTS